MATHAVITCPKCKIDNAHQYWDSHTKKMMGISEDGYMLSSKAPTDLHAKFETEYNCPTCNERIRGVDLINDGEVRV